VTISEYISQIKQVEVGGINFLVILYRDNRAGDNKKLLGSVGSLRIFSRRRIRTPYHVTLRSADEPQPQQGKQFSEWYWHLSPRILEDAIEFAYSTSLIVTFSTVKSGASTPLSLHFQGVPRTVEWNGIEYELFGSLLHSQSKDSCFGEQRAKASIREYPVFVAKVVGQKRDVCEEVLRLCLGYDHLKSFNLIISSSEIGEAQSESEVAVYFVPRRFDGQVIPTRYRQNRWAFGSFEMAGVFLTKDGQVYNQLSSSGLLHALREVSIQRQSHEGHVIENLLCYP